MGEVIAITVLAAAGFGILSPASRVIPRVALGAMAFPIGATAYTLVAALELVIVGRVEPVAALVATAVVGAAGMTAAIARGAHHGLGVTAAVVIGGVGILAVTMWLIPLTRLTIDSLRYVISAFDLQLADGVTQVQPADLLKRQLGLPAWQSLASLTDRRYVAGIGPAFGVSGTVMLGWLVWTAGAGLSARRRRLAVAAAVAVAVASNRFLYDWFYINTHVAMATLVLIGVAGLWMATTRDEPAWALPAGLSLAGLLVLRPESPLVVALVLIAFAPEIRSRMTGPLTWGPILVTGTLWYALTLWPHAPDGSEIALDAPVFMGLVAIVGSVGVVALGSSGFDRLSGLARAVLLPALAGALVVATLLDPVITIDSIVVTAQNVGYRGLWMFTWTVMVPALAIALVVQRFPGGRAWATIVAGYGLLFFMLPHLRGSPWRFGSGDSGNRILAHILLVAIAFLLLAATDAETDDGTEVVGSEG